MAELDEEILKMTELPQDEESETEEETITRIVKELLKQFRPHYHRTYGMHNITLGNRLWHPYFWTDIQGALDAITGFQNNVLLCPIYFPAAMTISQMTCNIIVAGAGGTFLRLGLYADNGGSPLGGALLFDSGNINAAVTGPVNAAFPVPLARPKGVSTWAAIITNSALQLAICQTRLGLVEVGAEMMNGCDYAQAFGAFTNPCPAVAAEDEARMWGFVRVDSVQPL